MLPITTSRLLIRPLALGDTDAVLAYRSDAEITRYQMWRPTAAEDIRRFIREQAGCIPGMPGIWFQMAIVFNDSGELLGDCGIHVSMNESANAELGLTLKADAQHQGFASEALAALIDYCFTALHMSRVTARVFSMNLPALALVERLGFDFTGRIPSKLDDDSEGSDLFYVLEQKKRFPPTDRKDG